MSADEVKSWMMNLTNVNSLSQDQRDLLEEWVGFLTQSEEILENESESSEDILNNLLARLEYEKAVLEAKYERGEINEEKYEKELLKLLGEELDAYKDQLTELELQGATEEELLDVETDILNTEMEIWRLKHEQNKEADDQLSKIIRQRQEQIKLARATGYYGAVGSTDQEIENYLRTQGKSEDYIKDFMANLPKYQQGGIVPETGLALVHKNETIIPADISKKYGIKTLDDLAKNSYTQNSDSAKVLSMPRSYNYASGDTTLNLTVNINNEIGQIDSNNIDTFSSEISKQVGKVIYNSVNTGLKTGKIDIRNSN
jgi:hypothetical protein